MKIIYPEKPSLSFREWMWKVVQSEHYSNEDAMSRAQESLNEKIC